MPEAPQSSFVPRRASDDGREPGGGGELRAAAALSSCGIGGVAAAGLRAKFGSLAQALLAGASAMTGAVALAEHVRLRVVSADLAALAATAVEDAARVGATLVAFGGPDYPPALAEIASPPPVLWVRGALAGEATRVAIVGARETDAYGRELAESIASGLARAGVEVVSGGAAGVDAAAHEGALRAGGRTVAVFGTGIDRAFPAMNHDLFERIERAGALVSELPVGDRGHRGAFPARNRLISGLSLGVVVVRAGEHSGSLQTAAHAKKQGRRVLAVPGDLRDALSVGPMLLLRDGAVPVANAADVLAALGLPQAPATPAPDLSALGGAEKDVLGALGARPRQLDDLAQTLGVNGSSLLRTLTGLELAGLCVQRPGKYFQRA